VTTNADRHLSRADLTNRIRAIRGEPPLPVEPDSRAGDWAYVVVKTADGPVVIANDGVDLDHDPGVANLWRSELESAMASVAPEHRKAWLADLVAIRRVFPDSRIESIGRRSS
jgi:hypothetical protein